MTLSETEATPPLRLTGRRQQVLPDGQVELVLETSRGEIPCLLHPAVGGAAVIWVCGALGGKDGPSFGIYRQVADDLVASGITSLRLDYRNPGYIPDCVRDVLAGVEYLEGCGQRRVGLVGHSFGGAVVIQAGILSPAVKTVVGLSSQTYGASEVARLAPKPLLLVHGERDRNLPADCSRHIYARAGEPKKLIIYPNNGHFLRECHDELRKLLRGWLVEKLGEDRAGLQNTPPPV